MSTLIFVLLAVVAPRARSQQPVATDMCGGVHDAACRKKVASVVQDGMQAKLPNSTVIEAGEVLIFNDRPDELPDAAVAAFPEMINSSEISGFLCGYGFKSMTIRVDGVIKKSFDLRCPRSVSPAGGAPQREVRKESVGPQQSQRDPQVLASAAVDKFLKGVKLADLAEGKAMLAETQWITGAADFGKNFYERPEYTDAKTIFEGMFDTDIAGVKGYKRLMEMDVVSQAGTPMKVRYLAIAYSDRGTGEWKVLDTGTDSSVDIERNLNYFEKELNDTYTTSELSNFLSYGHWLLKAGRIRAAKEALLHARTANPIAGYDADRSTAQKYLPIQKAQIEGLLAVIGRVAGPDLSSN